MKRNYVLNFSPRFHFNPSSLISGSAPSSNSCTLIHSLIAYPLSDSLSRSIVQQTISHRLHLRLSLLFQFSAGEPIRQEKKKSRSQEEEEELLGDSDLHPGDKPHVGKQMGFFFPPLHLLH